MTMDIIDGVELVFDADSPFVCMPDVVRSKADIPTSRQRAVYIGRNGSSAYLDLPNDTPAPVAGDDGLILARADLRTTLDKAHWIGEHGGDAYLALPVERPAPE
ncbi:MAG TPA: hypothetical protein VK196_22585 [Magnetospirillum sp.]|nr:hypothetical protein [Magnetospirillum sp.]